MKDIRRLEIMFEDMQSKMQLMAEAISLLADDMREVKASVSLIPEMRADVSTIKHALTLHSRQLNNHDVRILKLERHHRLVKPL